MDFQGLVFLIAAVCLVLLLLLIWLSFKHAQQPSALSGQALEDVAERFQLGHRTLEVQLKDDLQRSGAGLRTELGASIANFTTQILAQQGEAGRTQNAQLDAVAQQLTLMQKGLSDSLALQQAQLGERLSADLKSLAASNELRLGELRLTVEQRLRELQSDNEKKLEQMRQTVDEKLHATLEQRLGENFKQVAERLDQVHRGLGEMQGLAQGVGDLKHLLTNVKTRGLFGETQLYSLLEQVLSAEQYAKQLKLDPKKDDAVDAAVKLPGKGADGAPMWLPIDSKFPMEDFERLQLALEAADNAGAQDAARSLEARVRSEAKAIASKYILPPHTTSFAILFLPAESLYAEVLRRPGLVEGLQREFNIIICGPSTLFAVLTSLQMGFKSLALEKRSSEVWQVLGTVKTEFIRFGDLLEKTKKKLQEASNTMDDAATRTRVLGRALKNVEQLDGPGALELLAGAAADPQRENENDSQNDGAKTA